MGKRERHVSEYGEEVLVHANAWHMSISIYVCLHALWLFLHACACMLWGSASA